MRLLLQMRPHEVLARVEDVLDASVPGDLRRQGLQPAQTQQRGRRAARLQDPAPRGHEHAALAADKQNGC